VILKALFLIAISVLSYGCESTKTLILSNQLQASFASPKSYIHTYNSLIFKYDGWWISHEVIDSTRLYPSLDLGDNFRPFLRSIFQPELNSTLPENLVKLSSEQRKFFEIADRNIIKKDISGAEVLGFYDEEKKKGYIFVLEDLLVHRIDTSSNKKSFHTLLNSIRVR